MQLLIYMYIKIFNAHCLITYNNVHTSIICRLKYIYYYVVQPNLFFFVLFVHSIWNKKDRSLYIHYVGDLGPNISKETAVIKFLTTGLLMSVVTTGLKPKIFKWALASLVRHN